MSRVCVKIAHVTATGIADCYGRVMDSAAPRRRSPRPRTLTRGGGLRRRHLRQFGPGRRPATLEVSDRSAGDRHCADRLTQNRHLSHQRASRPTPALRYADALTVAACQRHANDMARLQPDDPHRFRRLERGAPDHPAYGFRWSVVGVRTSPPATQLGERRRLRPGSTRPGIAPTCSTARFTLDRGRHRLQRTADNGGDLLAAVLGRSADQRLSRRTARRGRWRLGRSACSRAPPAASPPAPRRSPVRATVGGELGRLREVRANREQHARRCAGSGAASPARRGSPGRRRPGVTGRGPAVPSSGWYRSALSSTPQPSRQKLRSGVNRSKNLSIVSPSWSLSRLTGAWTSRSGRPSLERRSQRLGKHTEPAPNTSPSSPGDHHDEVLLHEPARRVQRVQRSVEGDVLAGQAVVDGVASCGGSAAASGPRDGRRARRAPRGRRRRPRGGRRTRCRGGRWRTVALTARSAA